MIRSIIFFNAIGLIKMQKQRKRAENTAKRVLFVFVSEKRPVSTGRVRESEAKKEISFALEPSGSCKSEIKIRFHLEVNPYFFSGGEESRTPVQNHVHARSYKRSLRI